MFAGARQPMPAGMTNAMDFTSLMDIAGYQITDVQSSIGIIPGAVMTFGIAREMSDADHLSFNAFSIMIRWHGRARSPPRSVGSFAPSWTRAMSMDRGQQGGGGLPAIAEGLADGDAQ